jgi:hypothetical protein
MGECMERLIATYPRDFILEIQSASDAGFAEADRLAKQFIEEPEQSNMLGQLRHARLEAGFRTAAARHGLHTSSPHTNPKGGRYSVVSSGEITLIRGNVQAHRGPPRATKFRKQVAETNRWLSPLQIDFYLKTPDPSRDRLCAVLVIAAHKRAALTVPDWVGIGFPHHDLNSWVEIRSLSEILSMYHDIAIPSRSEVPVEIKDKARPQLKKDRRGG